MGGGKSEGTGIVRSGPSSFLGHDRQKPYRQQADLE